MIVQSQKQDLKISHLQEDIERCEEDRKIKYETVVELRKDKKERDKLKERLGGPPRALVLKSALVLSALKERARKAGIDSDPMEYDLYDVRFLLKDLHFLLKNPDFLLKNLHFLIKNLDFTTKSGVEEGAHQDGARARASCSCSRAQDDSQGQQVEVGVPARARGQSVR